MFVWGCEAGTANMVQWQQGQPELGGGGQCSVAGQQVGRLWQLTCSVSAKLPNAWHGL